MNLLRIIKLVFVAFTATVLLWGLPGLATFDLDDSNSTFAAQQGKGKDKGKGKNGEYPPPPKEKGKDKDKGKQKGKQKGKGAGAESFCTDAEEDEDVVCRVGGFGAGTAVQWEVIDSDGDVVCTGTAIADEDGFVEVNFAEVEECDLEPGTYTAEFTGEDPEGEPRVVTLDFTIEPEPGRDDGFLARTGRFITNGLVLGLGLVLLGSTAVYGVRRFRGSSVSP